MRAGLYSRLYSNRTIHAEEVVEFLQSLGKKVPGEWTVVWDRNNIHGRSKVVTASRISKETPKPSGEDHLRQNKADASPPVSLEIQDAVRRGWPSTPMSW